MHLRWRPSADDPFLLNLVTDGAKPLSSNYMTKQLQVLKGYLRVEDQEAADDRAEARGAASEAFRVRRPVGVDRRRSS